MARLGRGRPIQPHYVRRAVNPPADPASHHTGAAIQASGEHFGHGAGTVLSGALIVASGTKTTTGSASVAAGPGQVPAGAPGAPGSQLSGAVIRASGTKKTTGSATVTAAAGQVPAGAKAATGSARIAAWAAGVPAGTKVAHGSALGLAAAAGAANGWKTGHGAGTQRTGALSVVSTIPVQLAGSWTASFTAPTTPAGLTSPAAAPIPVTGITNSPGNWLFAIVAWRQAPGYPPVTFSVGDGSNVWDPVGAPNGTSTPDGSLRVAVWRAPAARAVSVVCAAPTGFCLSATVTVIEITGLFPWVTEAGCVTAFAAGATSLPALTTTGSVPVFWITALARGLSSAVVTYPSGWLPGPASATGNGLDHDGDLALVTALHQTSNGATATWAESAAADMAGILCGVQVFSPPPVLGIPNWAPGVFEIAPGAGVGTPPDELTWVPVDDQVVDGVTVPVRMQNLDLAQGQQYTVGSLQSGQGSVQIDNRDLAVLPPGIGPFENIDSGTPWRYRAVWPGGGAYPVNPTPHYAIAGFTLDLPATWTSGTRRGIITAGLTDAWAFCQPQIQSSLRQEMLADGPVHVWPCGDATGAQYASNIAPGSAAALVMVTSKYGNAGAAAAFGASASLSAVQAAVSTSGSGGLPGDGGSVWAQTGMPSGVTPGGFCLYCQASDFPGLNSPAGYSIECWSCLLDPAPLQQAGTLWAIKGSTGLVMKCWCDTTGALWLTTQDVTGAQTATSLGPVSFAAGGIFQTAVTWLDGTGWIAYVNGAQAAASASAPMLAPSYAWVSAGGESDRFTSGGMFDGQTLFLADFPVALPPSRVAAHFQAGNTAFQGEPDSARIERLLEYAGYTGPRVIKQADPADLCASLADLGTTTATGGVGTPTPAGQGSVQAGQEMTALVASLTPAMLTVAATGELVWQPKGLQYGQPAVWVLDDAGNGIPYQPDVQFGWDPQRVLNLIQLTQVDRQDIVGPQAFVPLAPGYLTPAQSQGQYAQQTYQITAYLDNDLTTPVQSGNPSNVLDLANWISVTLAAPHLRAGRVTVDAAKYPAAWPLILGGNVGDMALIGRAPVTAATSISLLARIMRIERQITFGAGGTTGQAALTLDYAPEAAPLVWGDPDAGQLTGARVLTW